MKQPSVLSFGEILWDLFPEEQVIGGAPFNFAAHLTKLGAEVTFVSAVGNDTLGKDALAQIRKTGMRTDHTAVLDGFPTGYCKVTLQGGTPSYELARNVAYDHIPFPARLPDSLDALYCGTLASRMEDSKSTLLYLLDTAKVNEVFFDVNIRGNDWSEALLRAVLPHTTVLKFSREEAPVLLEVFGAETIETLCGAIAQAYQRLRQILVTLDKDGACVYETADGAVLYAPKPQSKALSTVGAGDSFSACYLYNRLCGADTQTCLTRACALSDFVVTRLGAVPEYPKALVKRIK